MQFALTDHVEGPRLAPSADIFAEVVDLARHAERLGFTAVWFSEHHGHAHAGHMPAPLLLALHVAGQTRTLQVGTTVLCLTLHHPIEVAENLAVADLLTGGRLSIGLGSGTTAPEARIYGVDLGDRVARHERLAEALDILERAWSGEPFIFHGRHSTYQGGPIMPRPATDLPNRLWLAATSIESAMLAGRRGVGLMLPRERSRGYLNPLVDAYQAARADAGWPADRGRVSIGVALYVGETDASVEVTCADAVAQMVSRNRRERSVVAALPEPRTWHEKLDQALFVAGTAAACRDYLLDLTRRVPCDVVDIQPRWEGLPSAAVAESLARFATEVMPALNRAGTEA